MPRKSKKKLAEIARQKRVEEIETKRLEEEYLSRKEAFTRREEAEKRRKDEETEEEKIST
jgi:hypothetical protein